MAKRLDPDDIAKLTKQQLAALLANGTEPHALAVAASNLGETNIEATLRIYDALLDVPLDDLGLFPPCNATYWLVVANEKRVDKARTRRYLKRWAPVAKRFTMIYLNAAELHLALGEKARAIAVLREAVLEGDHQIAGQLRDTSKPDALAPLRGLAGFKALLKLKPLVPPGLRGIHAAIALGLDPDVEEAASAADLELVYERFDDEVADLELLVGHLYSFEKRAFKAFGMVRGSGDLAFWERTPKLPLAKQPIVIFGAKGNLSVYARDFDGFLALLGHGCSIREMESVGFRFDDDDWSPPKKGSLEKLKPHKKFLAAAAKWSTGVAKRKPTAERDAALALVPAFHAAMRKLCRPSS